MEKQTCYIERDPTKTVLNEGFKKACKPMVVQDCDSGLMVLSGYPQRGNIVDDINALAKIHNQTGIRVSPHFGG